MPTLSQVNRSVDLSEVYAPPQRDAVGVDPEPEPPSLARLRVVSPEVLWTEPVRLPDPGPEHDYSAAVVVACLAAAALLLLIAGGAELLQP